jgi:hypothetical protein
MISVLTQVESASNYGLQFGGTVAATRDKIKIFAWGNEEV